MGRGSARGALCLRDHAKHILVPLDQALHQNELRAVVFEELLRLGGKVSGGVAPIAVDTHRHGQEVKIGVGHASVGVSSIPCHCKTIL